MMKRLKLWWDSLEMDADREEIEKKGYFAKRDKPLTLKEFFLRDKKAVFFNVILPSISIILIIVAKLKGWI